MVCMLSGRFEVDETIYSRLPIDAKLTIRTIGDDFKTVLDG